MYNWAFRLGASPDEAIVFSQLDKEIEIWDDLAALMASSGYKSFSRGLRGMWPSFSTPLTLIWVVPTILVLELQGLPLPPRTMQYMSEEATNSSPNHEEK